MCVCVCGEDGKYTSVTRMIFVLHLRKVRYSSRLDKEQYREESHFYSFLHLKGTG